MYSQNNNFIKQISEKYQYYKQDILSTNLGEDLCNKMSEGAKKSFFKYQEFLYQYMKDLNDFSNQGNHIDNRGIFVYHGLGSGKTTSGIIISEACRNYNLNKDDEHYDTKPEYLRKVILMIPANLFFDPWVKEISSKCYSNCQVRDAINKILKDNKNLIESKLKKIITEKLKEFDFHIIYYNAYTLKGGYKDKLLEIPSRKITTDKYTNKYSESVNPFDDAVVVIDECHNLMNMISNKLKDDKPVELYNDLFNSQNSRMILLSSTPIINDVFEVSILSNILRGSIKDRKEIKFEDNYVQFQNLFINETDSILKNTNMIKRRLNGLVSYNKGINETVFAKEIIENVYLPFSQEQQDGYMKAEELVIKQKNIEENNKNSYDQSSLYKRKATNVVFPKYLFDQKDLNNRKLKKNGKLINPIAINNKNLLLDTTITKELEKQIIQILDNDDKPLNVNNDLYKISKKVYQIIKKIKESNGPVLVYSKFEGLYGIKFIAEALKQNGFNQYKKDIDSSLLEGTFMKWTGNDRNNAYKDIFNSVKNKDGKIIKVFLMTSSGKEGINLMGIRQIHILEPWWNNTIIKQIIGRGIRICSHNHIDKKDFIDLRFKEELRVFNDRFVNIFKYYAFIDLRANDKPKDYNKKEMKRRSIDYKIKEKADNKEKLEKQILKLLKEVAIDCDINYERNNEDILCYIDSNHKNYFDSWNVKDDEIQIVKKKYDKIKINNELFGIDQFKNLYKFKENININFNNLDNDVIKIGKYENGKIIYDNNFHKNQKVQKVKKTKVIKNYIKKIFINNKININQNVDYTGIYDKNLILSLKTFDKMNFYTNQNLNKINKLNEIENKITIKKEDDVLENDILIINKLNYDIEKTINGFKNPKYIMILNINPTDVLLFNKNVYYQKHQILLIHNQEYKSDLHKFIKELDMDIENRLQLIKDLNKMKITSVEQLTKYLKDESKLSDTFSVLKMKLKIEDEVKFDIKNFNDCMKMLVKDIKKSKEYKDIPRKYNKSKMKKEKICETIKDLNQ